MPAGYSVRWVGQVDQLDQARAALLSALAISILLIYMLLVALYESWLEPFAIMFALPVALVAGELDTKFLELARRLAKDHVAARVVAVPGAGHNVVLEAPEHLAEILREALA